LSLDKRKHIYTSLKTLHTQVMTPTVQISPSPSSSSLSSGASSLGDHQVNRDNWVSSPASASSRSTTTPLPPDHDAAPPRTGSASSASSLSSQQTIRASQLPQHGKLANGAVSNFPSTRLRSRSPRHRGLSTDPSVPPTANGDAPTTTTAETRPRSMTGSSSRTAHPLARPHLASPSDVLGSDSPSSSRGKGPAARLGVMDVLREWLRSYTPIARGSRVPAAVIFVAIVLPLIAFIVRLRMRRRSAPPSGPTRLITHGMANTKTVAGTNAVRWLYEAVRDSVVMAGKGLV